MADLAIDINHLPEDIRLKLAELELELSEGNMSFYDIFEFLSKMSHSGSLGYDLVELIVIVKCYKK